MLILLSPAKSLDFTKPAPNFSVNCATSEPRLLPESRKLIKIARKLDRATLMNLMGVSENIADLNVERFANWKTPFTLENAKPAVFAFTGDVYQGMKPENWTEDDAAFAQKHLRILSGLYGVLRPLDLMQAYRLEMGTVLQNERGTNLYHFWKDKIVAILNSDLRQQKSTIIVNLASDEYFKAVDAKQINGKIYTVGFRELRNEQYKVISFSAKRARGMMANYIVQHRLETIDELRNFKTDNYLYNETLSTEFNLVFTR